MVQLTPTSEETRVYEICVLYPYPLSQKEEKELLGGIDELLKEAEAKELHRDNWGRRGLAYRIGGYEEGCYVIYYVEMKPENLSEFDQNLRIQQGVLRHLIIKPPKRYEVVDYSKSYEEWLQSREQEEENKKKRKEEELKKKMIDRQKRQTKKAETQKKEEAAGEEKAPVEEEKISAEIDKLIADDELEL